MPRKDRLSKCKLIIKDEVNIKVEGLDVVTRRKIVNKLKFDLPYARHMPAYKLGRWDGTKTYFGIGGNGYLTHLDVILPIIEQDGYEIEVEDHRRHHDFKFATVTENYWADQGKTWPKGHPEAGKPIVLRDYQYDVVNQFLANPQSLQEVATGAGKTKPTKCKNLKWALKYPLAYREHRYFFFLCSGFLSYHSYLTLNR